MDTEQVVEVVLTTLVYGGEALGRLADGRAIFVPFALPGERVRAQIVEQKNRYVRAKLLEILSPAPQRISPRCVHYGLCGGCHYQHLPYEAQAAAKADILRDQLQRIGGIEAPIVMPTIPSPPWNYRNHVQFHLTTEGALGYYTQDAGRIFPIQECHLPQPLINQVWPQLDFEALPEVERIGIRQGAADDLQLILESSQLSAPGILIEDLDVSVIHLSPAGSLVLAGSPATTLEVLGRSFQVSAASFFQVNTVMAEKMVEYILGELSLPPNAVVLDVFCGVGLFSAFLAPIAGRLIGIEESPDACSDFEVNLDDFGNVELYEAPAEQALPALSVKPDLILLDPPRAGLKKSTLETLADLSAPHIIYVSCDPATLARDARQLSRHGYKLQSSTPFDLFPQTYHIESINIFTR